MAGINFNDLPKNLQQKLQPYITVTGGNVEAAIETAKLNGKWSAADEKSMKAFNGNKAWGVFDGFEKTEVGRYQADTQEALKTNPATAMAQANKKANQRNVQEHPEQYQPRMYKMDSGRYVVYQKSVDTGKSEYRYYDANGREMAEMAFKSKEGIIELKYVTGKEHYLPTKGASTDDKSYIASQAGKLLITTASANASNNAGFIFTACSKDDKETDMRTIVTQNVTIPIHFDTTEFTKSMMDQNTLLQKINDILAQIENNTGATANEIAAFKAEIAELKLKLTEINNGLVKVITNQENFAENADNYFQQILGLVGNSNELLAFIVDGMTQNNATLAALKALMEENNADNKEILEALSKCKFGIDQLHEDSNEIKELIAQIQIAMEKLPSDIKSELSGYFKSIILGIADNGAKLQALTNMLKVVNANVVAGNTAILKKMDRMQEAIDALFAKFSSYDAKVTKALNAMATAIANLTAKVDKIDLGKIENTLSAILDKIGNNGKQLEDITKLLQTINGNVVLNGARQEKILAAINKLGDLGVKISGDLDTIIKKLGNNEAKLDALIKLLQTMDANNETRNQKILAAIKDLDGDMINGFATLIEIGNKNNALTEDTNKLINEAIALLKNLKMPNVEVNLDKVIEAINKQGGDIKANLQCMTSILNTINKNVVDGNDEINKMLAKILEAIKNKTTSPSSTTVNVDLSKIESKLDNILKAIKDHKVLVEVNGEVKCNCNCGNNSVHEGVKEDLNWLLG